MKNRKQLYKFGLIGSTMALALLGGSVALAMPSQATAHAIGAAAAASASSASAASSAAAANASNVSANTSAANGQATGQAHLAAAQLKACQNRQNAISNIMTNITTRSQNQLTLFTTIATRVETFYTTGGKTLSSYDQLVAAVNAAKTQATTDLSTMRTNSVFSCSSSDPKGTVNSFQQYLKTEITDLQNYRTSVKNLIVGVASVNGVTVSGSNTSTITQGSAQ